MLNFNIKEDEAKEQVDSFLAGGVLNYVLVYLIIQYVIKPVLTMLKDAFQKHLGNTIVGKFLKR